MKAMMLFIKEFNMKTNKHNLDDFLKPSFFLTKTRVILPYLIILFISFSLAGFYLSLFKSPVDFIQGEQYRILYIHVPAAWLSSNCYYFLAISSIFYLTKKSPFSFILAKVSAQIGSFFTVLTLLTGSLWGKPMWGVYWVWDARLTSVLVLLFLYISYLILVSFRNRNFQTISSIFSIFGLINIPIIKFSVKWWNTLHQPASITKMGNAMHLSMLYPLFIMFIAFLLFLLILYIFLIRNELLKKKINSYTFKYNIFNL